MIPSISVSSIPEKSTNVRLNALRTIFGLGAQISPEWAAAIFERLFLTTRRRPTPLRESRWLDGSKEDTTHFDNHHLAIWSWGQGPTVLLVHGWEGRGSQMAAFAAPLVAAGFRAVTFDATGHGRSSGKKTNLVEMAQSVAAVSRWAGGVDGVIAHSAGAAATTIAVDRGLAVGRLVYLAPAADLARFHIPLASYLGLPREIALMAQMSVERKIGARWSELAGPALASGMEVPLTVFHDREDREVGWENGRDLVRPWPGARLRLSQGLGHRRILRDPEVISESLRWLEPLTQGASKIEKEAEPGLRAEGAISGTWGR